MDYNRGKNIFDRLIESLAFIAGISLLLVTLFVSYAVITRYLNLKPPIWVLQFTEYGLLWITFLGTAWLLREDGHIRVDTVVSRLGPKSFRTVQLITDILGFIVSILIFWYGTRHTIDLYQRGIMDVRGVSIPKFALFMIIPFGGLTLSIQIVRNFFNHLRKPGRENDR